MRSVRSNTRHLLPPVLPHQRFTSAPTASPSLHLPPMMFSLVFSLCDIYSIVYLCHMCLVIHVCVECGRASSRSCLYSIENMRAKSTFTAHTHTQTATRFALVIICGRGHPDHTQHGTRSVVMRIRTHCAQSLRNVSVPCTVHPSVYVATPCQALLQSRARVECTINRATTPQQRMKLVLHFTLRSAIGCGLGPDAERVMALGDFDAHVLYSITWLSVWVCSVAE